MGLGWWIFNKQEHITHWHGGGAEGFTSRLAFCKEHEYAIAVLTNVGSYGHIDEIRNAVINAQFEG